MFRPLLARYGPAVVYLAGIKELRFPPTWVTWFSEFKRVRDFLINTYGD
ncbi:hypothetical protein [Frigoriglobus tundricola]|uniref:Uncharacterized protein n=1 Tax=Frigoriglobus tundricola TaxID=2774151 RepID=A0A6M5YL89_9BACT|nr:hypothetical protein [Frigoriglobus tundricola]QJW94738.1 hypothetical protein FTUN_2260 [Frigoriglobus tundricola]